MGFAVGSGVGSGVGFGVGSSMRWLFFVVRVAEEIISLMEVVRTMVFPLKLLAVLEIHISMTVAVVPTNKKRQRRPLFLFFPFFLSIKAPLRGAINPMGGMPLFVTSMECVRSLVPAHFQSHPHQSDVNWEEEDELPAHKGLTSKLLPGSQEKRHHEAGQPQYQSLDPYHQHLLSRQCREGTRQS